jgi:DNA-binding NarL/FixJ family response regulator
MRELKIVIADDHPVIRLGLRTILEAQPGWSVPGEAVTGYEAVALALEHRPEVVITSISLPELNGLDATRQIRRDSPETEVLVLTMHNSGHLLEDAFAAGARGYLLKTDSLRLLVAAVETIAEHKTFVSGSASQSIPAGLPRLKGTAHKGGPTRRVLGPREREVVQLLAEGASNKEIARKLGISVKTVNSHRSNVMRQLNVHSIAGLVRYAIRETIILA